MPINRSQDTNRIYVVVMGRLDRPIGSSISIRIPLFPLCQRTRSGDTCVISSMKQSRTTLGIDSQVDICHIRKRLNIIPKQSRIIQRIATGNRIFITKARVTGLEPAASSVTGWRSNQLSYTPLEFLQSKQLQKFRARNSRKKIRI